MKRFAVAVVAAALLGAAGCGGSDSGSGSDEEQIQALADDYSQAALDGDYTAACDTFSSEAIEQINNLKQFDSCEDLVEAGLAQLDASQKEELANLSNIQVDGDTATAEGRDGEITFIKENGEWKAQLDG
jgi:hypothetical protein